MEEVKAKMANMLQELRDYQLQHCFEQWKIQIEHCLKKEGESIEGDKC